jgi:hypothetical protein
MGKKGKLVFKGEKRPKKKSKKSKADKGSRTEEHDALSLDQRPITDTFVPSVAKPQASSLSSTPTIQEGTGRITTSGTVVTGHDTKFEKEISTGDAILVKLNNNGSEEMRVVTMRLSDASLNLSSAFSENLREPLSFRYVRKPRNLREEQRKERKQQLEEAGALEKNAFDIYGNSAGKSTNVFTYREKTETGSYRVKQQQLSSSSSSSQTTTRGDLLTLRSKKTSDKYC